MNSVKKSLIVIGPVAGYALFLWSIYRLFNAAIVNVVSFLILIAGIALIIGRRLLHELQEKAATD